MSCFPGILWLIHWDGAPRGWECQPVHPGLPWITIGGDVLLMRRVVRHFRIRVRTGGRAGRADRQSGSEKVVRTNWAQEVTPSEAAAVSDSLRQTLSNSTFPVGSPRQKQKPSPGWFRDKPGLIQWRRKTQQLQPGHLTLSPPSHQVFVYNCWRNLHL